MKLGTKSILFGAHCFFLHPWFVAWGWWKLYGFPWDPRLWIAFIVHDWGYWGCSNIDGSEGERHPYRGAKIMDALFHWSWDGHKWYYFVLYHSRYLSQIHSARPSRLCWADKLAAALTPWWLYVPMTRATGEIREYTATVKSMDAPMSVQGLRLGTWASDVAWFKRLQSHWRELAYVSSGVGSSKKDP